MTIEEASDFVIPFGKYGPQRLTLKEIAEDEDDLDYLIWLKGARDDDEFEHHTDLDEALEVFLDNQ